MRATAPWSNNCAVVAVTNKPFNIVYLVHVSLNCFSLFENIPAPISVWAEFMSLTVEQKMCCACIVIIPAGRWFLVSTVARPEHVTTARERGRARETAGRPGYLHPRRQSSADETPVTFRAASREKVPCFRRGCLHVTWRHDGGQNTVESAWTHPKPTQEDLDAV